MGQFLDKIDLKGDRVIWVIVLILSLISLIIVYSSTGTLAYKIKGGNTSYFFIKQLILLAGCYMIIWVVHAVPYRLYSSWANLILLSAVILLVMTRLFGTSLNEAARWITIPGIGFNFQPSELAKLALILHVARILSRHQTEKGCNREAFWQIMGPTLVVCGLIFWDDFSTAALLGLVCFIMMFIGRVNARQLWGTIGIGILLLVALIMLAPILPTSFGRIQTVRNRIVNFSNNDAGSYGYNYQVEQSKIAVVGGGIFGKGPGNSEQRNFLPHPYSDFIYAIIVEELGWFGGFGILSLYLFLMFRAGIIVKRCTRTFPAFLVTGLVLGIVFQALTNIAVSVNLIPVTGQSLPLVSMGGTSLVFTSVAFGMILSVSRSFQKEGDISEKEH